MIDWYRKELQSYKNTSVLVTGGSGFFGNRLISILEDLNADVVRTTRSHTLSKNKQTIQVDLTDLEETKSLLQSHQYEIIFHLSGWVSSNNNFEHVRTAYNNNLLSTLNLLENSVRYSPGTKMVIPGSELEYSHIITPYSVSKNASSMYVDLFKNHYNANITSLKICLTYGPTQNQEGLVPHIIKSFFQSDDLLTLNLNRECDALYIDDVVNALLLSGLSKHTPNTIHIGSGQHLTVKNIADNILHLMGKNTALIEYIEDITNISDINNVKDINPALEYINWAPSWNLASGLTETINWFTQKMNTR